MGERIFQEVNAHLEEKGLRLSEGAADVVIINAPSSTKNREKKRDPDMHSTKKGNRYSIGMKIHLGVDRENKTIRSLVTTPANVHYSRMVECAHEERKKQLTEEDKESNRLLSKTRSHAEHIFLIAKKVFVFSKVRYKGLAKNTNFIFMFFALSNLYMLRRDLLEPTGA